MIDLAPPPPAQTPRPDPFAEISFNVQGATAETFDVNAFKNVLSETTGVQPDWIEVIVSSGGPTSRRRRRLHALRSLLQDDSSGLAVDAKFYTNDPEGVVSSVKAAVENGNVKQKLAEANNSISNVQTTKASIGPSGSGSKSNVGAIVGGVVGGLAGLALVGTGLAVWHKRRSGATAASLDPALPTGSVTTSQFSSGSQSIPTTLTSTETALVTGAAPGVVLTSLATSPPARAPPPVQPPAAAARSSRGPFAFFNSRAHPPTRPIDPFMSWISDQVASNPQPPSTLTDFAIDFKLLHIERPIGEGSFGRVYAATLKGAPVAVKVLMDVTSGRLNDPLVANPALNSSAPIMRKLQEEVKIMSVVDHPNVVKFIGVCSMPPCIITELYARGSLTDVLKAAGASPRAATELGWRRRLAMAVDAAEGMCYLHSQSPPIIHRDLKSANMLVGEDFRASISDFNLSKILDDSTRSSSLAAMNPRFLAPELFVGTSPTPACDVFGMGVVLWELLTLEVPWGNTNPWQIVNTLNQGGRLPIPAREDVLGLPPSQECYDRFVALIKKCWAQIPEDRPEIGDVAEELR